MSDPFNGPLAPDNGESSLEFLLFDSLVHQLIEKGVLTKNDALSIVQTAALVVRGRMHEGGAGADLASALATLERAYSSFDALPDRRGIPRVDDHNVHQLRSPVHGDRPHFPTDD